MYKYIKYLRAKNNNKNNNNNNNAKLQFNKKHSAEKITRMSSN